MVSIRSLRQLKERLWLFYVLLRVISKYFIVSVLLVSKSTARPRGTLPHETLTLMGHCFEMGPKILRYTVLHCYLQHIIKM